MTPRRRRGDGGDWSSDDPVVARIQRERREAPPTSTRGARSRRNWGCGGGRLGRGSLSARGQRGEWKCDCLPIHTGPILLAAVLLAECYQTTEYIGPPIDEAVIVNAPVDRVKAIVVAEMTAAQFQITHDSQFLLTLIGHRKTLPRTYSWHLNSTAP